MYVIYEFILLICRQEYLSDTSSIIFMGGAYNYTSRDVYYTSSPVKSQQQLKTNSGFESFPGNPVSALTPPGASFLSQEIQKSTAAFTQASTDLTAKSSQCKSLKDAKTKNKCIPCIVAKCNAKADSCNRKLNVNGALTTLEDLGHKVSSTVKDVGHKISSTVKDVGHKIESGIKHVFGGWGKRRTKRSEPSCSEIEHNAGQACQKYDSACSECLFNPDSECPGYASASSAYDAAVHTYAWLKKVPTSGSTYQVTKVTYDPASFDPMTQTYKDVTAYVSLLTKTTSFRKMASLRVLTLPFLVLLFGNLTLQVPATSTDTSPTTSTAQPSSPTTSTAQSTSPNTSTTQSTSPTTSATQSTSPTTSTAQSTTTTSTAQPTTPTTATAKSSTANIRTAQPTTTTPSKGQSAVSATSTSATTAQSTSPTTSTAQSISPTISPAQSTSTTTSTTQSISSTISTAQSTSTTISTAQSTSTTTSTTQSISSIISTTQSISPTISTANSTSPTISTTQFTSPTTSTGEPINLTTGTTGPINNTSGESNDTKETTNMDNGAHNVFSQCLISVVMFLTTTSAVISMTRR
ncbi:uncharacterized protein LOC135480150 isoform X2 [Liolophura sinensis]|uniref:uncharacterized protein LOC135480150 isoform X2 n=1 Tax=Liolophura sinensis TaxID=3198878 RepID=UPI003158285F